MNIRTIGLFTVSCLAICAAWAEPASRPDFKGDWKLNVAKSDLGPMPVPTSHSMKVIHQGPGLQVATSIVGGPQGDAHYDSKYTTDGKESVNPIGPGTAKSKVTWDAGTLRINSDLDLEGAAIAVNGIWALSEDGNVLTQTAHVTSAEGEFDLKYVFEKQ